MEFEISHITDYSYQYAAAEAYLEARLTPPDLASQTVKSRKLVVEPAVKPSGYLDYFGNAVDFFSLPYRHKNLVVTSKVRNRDPCAAASAGGAGREHHRGAADPVGVADGRFRLLAAHGHRREEQGLAAMGAAVSGRAPAPGRIAGSVEPGGEPGVRLRERIDDQLHAAGDDLGAEKGGLPGFHARHAERAAHERVCPRVTCAATSRPSRRRARAPANPIGRAGRTLVGAIATHAWVEVLVPGMEWVALDPTNKQWCGERHITVSRGRDFRDATPLRGTFKGTGKQNMKVKVFVRRREGRTEGRRMKDEG